MNTNNKKKNLKNKYASASSISTIVMIIIILAGVLLFIKNSKNQEIIDDVSDINSSTVSASSVSENSNDETTESNGYLTARVLDIGQGDCILIRTPNKKTIIIDAGDYRDKAAVTTKLAKFGVEEIEYMIITHPDADHIGAAADIINKYPIKNFIMTRATKSSKTYENMITALEKHQDINIINGESGYKFDVDGVSFELLWPKGILSSKANETSIVTRVQYGKNTMLFMGDAEAVNETAVMHNYSSDYLKADFIKLGHHGSSTSSGYAFLTTVSPEYAAISCGKDNNYNHPHRQTINTLDKLGINYYRTDEDGTISVVSNGKVISVTTGD